MAPVPADALTMKATPYGSYSNIEFQDASGSIDGGRLMNPQRYNRFPTVAPILNSADVDSDRTFDRSSLEKKVLYRIGNRSNSHLLNENRNPSQGTSLVPDCRRNDEAESHMRNIRRDGAGYLKSYYQEGPSNYLHGSSDSQVSNSLNHYSRLYVPKTFEYLERDRAELLRKLSELEEQLVQSGSGGEQEEQRHRIERGKYHHESFGSSGDWLQENSSISSRASKMADKHVTCFSPFPDKHPYTERQNIGRGEDIQIRGVYFDSQISGRGTTSTSDRYQEYSSYPGNFPLQSTDAADQRISGSPHYYNIPLHQLDCSCFHCDNNRLSSPTPVQSRSPLIARSTDISGNLKFYHKKVAQKGYDSQYSNSSVAMGGRINHIMWPSEPVKTMDETAHGYPQSTVPVKVKRSFRPIAGCAPFVICSNCFELLQLSPDKIKFGNSRQKMQCGACSSVTYFVIEGKKLIFSIHREKNEKSKECGSNIDGGKESIKDSENISNEKVDEMLHTRGPGQTSKSFQSDELCVSVDDGGICDLEQVEHSSNIGVRETKEDQVLVPSLIDAVEETLSNHQCPKNYDYKSFQCKLRNDTPLMDKTPDLPAPIYGSILKKSGDAHSLISADKSEDDYPEKCAAQVMASADDASDDLNLSPSSTLLAHQEHQGYSPSEHAEYWFGTRSQIRRAIGEDNNRVNTAPSINLASEISAETEIETVTEVPHHETSKSNIHSDSKSGNEAEDPPNINSGISLAENIKDRVLKLAMSIQNVEDVTINRHPIADHLVRKAEGLAGPILPGNYWYDFQAGFWGVAGGPCLGIIPPKIKQFDYPISKNCSGGTTGVIVNGRELHKKDLALLHDRGLPIQRGKSYILEISGRVTDKDSGEELGSLGPLAPTIERLKRGFGMRAFRQQLPVKNLNMAEDANV